MAKRKKSIQLIAKALTGYAEGKIQRGISMSDDAWDKLIESVDSGAASSTLEASWLILFGIWFGNADATVEHNNDPLHKAASVLESLAWMSSRDIDELCIRIIALRDLVGIIREQRLQIEEMKPNILAE